MNEIVEYKNTMNDIILHGFSKQELSVFFSLCSKVKGIDDETINITFDEIKRLSEYSPKSNVEMSKFLKRLGKKILGATVVNDSKSGLDFELFVLFTKMKSHNENEPIPYLEVKVNQEFTFFLNNLLEEGGFTKFDLIDYVQFESSYTQECFRRLKQFRTTGWWKISIDKFRNLLDIPKSFRMSHIDERVLKPITDELTDYYNHFEIKKIYEKAGRGRPRVSHLEFFFDKESVEESVESKYEGLQRYEIPKVDRVPAQYPKPKDTSATSSTPEWSEAEYENQTTFDEKLNLQIEKIKLLSKMNGKTADRETVRSELMAYVTENFPNEDKSTEIERTLDLAFEESQVYDLDNLI